MLMDLSSFMNAHENAHETLNSVRTYCSCTVRGTARKKEGGVATPKIVMVKRKTDCYELLHDHRLFMIISIVCAITGTDRFSVTHTSPAPIIYMSPGYNV